MKWTQNVERYPERHRRYLVENRNGFQFVATPCFGMHKPWWVPMGPKGEAEPFDMVDDDKWIAIEEILR